MQEIDENDPSTDKNDIAFTDSEGNEIMLHITYEESGRFAFEISTSKGLKLVLEGKDVSTGKTK
jgi:hypothetical protein